jgi:hypothetical protein
MRKLLIAALPLLLVATPALAQFPPPGIYQCANASGAPLGTLTLLVAGDYQWQTPDGKSATGQVASAAKSVTAQSGPLADAHWKGVFNTVAGKTIYQFNSDAGVVTCK